MPGMRLLGERERSPQSSGFLVSATLVGVCVGIRDLLLLLLLLLLLPLLASAVRVF